MRTHQRLVNVARREGLWVEGRSQLLRTKARDVSEIGVIRLSFNSME